MHGAIIIILIVLLPFAFAVFSVVRTLWMAINAPKTFNVESAFDRTAPGIEDLVESLGALILLTRRGSSIHETSSQNKDVPWWLINGENAQLASNLSQAETIKTKLWVTDFRVFLSAINLGQYAHEARCEVFIDKETRISTVPVGNTVNALIIRWGTEALDVAQVVKTFPFLGTTTLVPFHSRSPLPSKLVRSIQPSSLQHIGKFPNCLVLPVTKQDAATAIPNASRKLMAIQAGGETTEPNERFEERSNTSRANAPPKFSNVRDFSQEKTIAEFLCFAGGKHATLRITNRSLRILEGSETINVWWECALEDLTQILRVVSQKMVSVVFITRTAAIEGLTQRMSALFDATGRFPCVEVNSGDALIISAMLTDQSTGEVESSQSPKNQPSYPFLCGNTEQIERQFNLGDGINIWVTSRRLIFQRTALESAVKSRSIPTMAGPDGFLMTKELQESITWEINLSDIIGIEQEEIRSRRSVIRYIVPITTSRSGDKIFKIQPQTQRQTVSSMTGPPRPARRTGDNGQWFWLLTFPVTGPDANALWSELGPLLADLRSGRVSQPKMVKRFDLQSLKMTYRYSGSIAVSRQDLVIQRECSTGQLNYRSLWFLFADTGLKTEINRVPVGMGKKVYFSHVAQALISAFSTCGISIVLLPYTLWPKRAEPREVTAVGVNSSPLLFQNVLDRNGKQINELPIINIGITSPPLVLVDDEASGRKIISECNALIDELEQGIEPDGMQPAIAPKLTTEPGEGKPWQATGTAATRKDSLREMVNSKRIWTSTILILLFSVGLITLLHHKNGHPYSNNKSPTPASTVREQTFHPGYYYWPGYGQTASDAKYFQSWEQFHRSDTELAAKKSSRAPTQSNSAVPVAHNTLSVSRPIVDARTGKVTVYGQDTSRPTTPFTWDWGDGSSATGFFPMIHTYADLSQNYVVTVTAHYADGGTDKKQVAVALASAAASVEAQADFNHAAELFKEAQYEECCKDFAQGLAKDPNAPMPTYVTYIAGCTYLRRGETAGAASEQFLSLFGWETGGNGNSDLSLYAVIFGYAGFRQSGNENAAKQLLDTAVAKCDSTHWPYPIVSYLHGDINDSALSSMIGNNRDHATDALTLLGIKQLYDNQTNLAINNFAWVVENGNRDWLAYTLAVVELRHTTLPKTSQPNGQALTPTQVDIEQAQSHYNRSDFFWKTSEFDKVCDEFDSAFALYPVPPYDTLNEYVAACADVKRGAAAGAFANFFLAAFGWNRPNSPYHVLYGYTGYLQAGNVSAAKQLLDEGAKKCNTTQWPYSLIVCLRGEMDVPTLFSQVERDPNRITEAKTFVGIQDLYNGNQAAALSNLGWVNEYGRKDDPAYFLADAEYKRATQSQPNLNTPGQPAQSTTNYQSEATNQQTQLSARLATNQLATTQPQPSNSNVQSILEKAGQNQPLGITDVESLAKASLSDDFIIREIRLSGGVYKLSAGQVVELVQAGVSQKVTDFMMTNGISSVPPLTVTNATPGIPINVLTNVLKHIPIPKLPFQ